MKVKHLQQALDTQAPHTGPGFHPHVLLLLGAGHAHIHALWALARTPLVGVQVVLVAPYPRQIDSAMVPGLVAGHYQLDECAIPLAELVRRAGVRWVQASVTAMDADARMVRLDNGDELAFDWVSINTGPIQDREAIEAAMPGARTHALYLRPIEGFTSLWPRVAAMGDERALRLAVIGAEAMGLEIAMALRHRLPHCAVTLISGDAPPAASAPPALRARVLQALKRRNITVLQQEVCGFRDGELVLASGARLACDVPLIATGPHAPRWLRGCGLALDAQGFVQVNAFQQSTSHAHVFAVGEVSTRNGQAPLARRNAALNDGPALLRNLEATVRGTALRAHHTSNHPIHLLSCGDKSAIAHWRGWSAQGRWVSWWKAHLERRFIARYASPDAQDSGR